MWSEAGSYIHQGLGLSSLVSTQYKSFYRVRVDRIGVQAPKGVLSNTGGLRQMSKVRAAKANIMD